MSGRVDGIFVPTVGRRLNYAKVNTRPSRYREDPFPDP